MGTLACGLPEIQQCRQAVCFRGFALKLRNLKFQRIVLTANLLVHFRRVLQREVFAPRIANQPKLDEPARSNGETAPTVQMRISRPSDSRLICTASM